MTARRKNSGSVKQKYPGAGHPWADFLHYRAILLHNWVTEEGKTFEECARSLVTDPMQVQLIVMTVAQHPEDYAASPPPPPVKP